MKKIKNNVENLKIDNKKIILASKSPRRRKLLEDIFGEDIIIHPSNIDENSIKEKDPIRLAKKLAFLKAKEVSKFYDRGIIIAADSFVVYKNKILGKPKDKKDAFNMLKLQSGKKTKVITGLCVIDLNKQKEYLTYDITEIKMTKMHDEEILNYIKTGDPLDKAGSFGMQSKGSIFVEKINGCYSNVVGLPMPKLLKIIRKIGLKIFNY
ncbi:MAG: Maf family protein [Candidatus Woesearchaeota archaeon]